MAMLTCDDYEDPGTGERAEYPDCDDDEPSYPDLGCACENALVVDRVCPDCIYESRRQEAEAEGGLRWAFWRFNEWWPGIPARVRAWRHRRAARKASAREELPF